MLSPSSTSAVEDAAVILLCQIFKTTASLKRKNKKKTTRMGEASCRSAPVLDPLSSFFILENEP